MAFNLGVSLTPIWASPQWPRSCLTIWVFTKGTTMGWATWKKLGEIVSRTALRHIQEKPWMWPHLLEGPAPTTPLSTSFPTEQGIHEAKQRCLPWVCTPPQVSGTCSSLPRWLRAAWIYTGLFFWSILLRMDLRPLSLRTKCEVQEVAKRQCL